MLAALRRQGDEIEKSGMSGESENELLRVNNQLCYFSENGRYLAVAFQTNLVVKSTENFETFRSFAFTDVIEYIEWSPNSEFVLCANIKKAVIQLYSVHYPEWKFRLTEGSAGLESVTWSPDSKHIITVADFNIQLSVWSLEDRAVTHIQNIKSSAFDKPHFSPNGNRLALIVTEDGQDSVEIYKTDVWKVSRKLICERLSSIDGICWSPNSELFCVWCSSSDEPKLLVYSTVFEKHIAVICPKKGTGLSDVPHDVARELRGIENVKWTPCGQFLAVAGFNEMVHCTILLRDEAKIALFNYVTWKPLLQLYLDPVIRESNYLNKVYKERVVQSKGFLKGPFEKRILEETHDRPINIRIGAKDETDKLSVAKIDIFEFSVCGQFLAVKHQLYPTTLWIWDVFSDYVEYLLLDSTIVAAKWSPSREHLLVFCECSHMFEWTPNGAKCVPTPRGITALNARWHPEGDLLALCGYNKAVIYRTEDETD